MSKNLGDFVAWVKNHPWLAGTAGAFGAAIASAVAEAIVSGSQSYALKAFRAIIFGWHPFPAFGWLVIGPLVTLGILGLRERYRPRRERCLTSRTVSGGGANGRDAESPRWSPSARIPIAAMISGSLKPAVSTAQMPSSSAMPRAADSDFDMKTSRPWSWRTHAAT